MYERIISAPYMRTYTALEILLKFKEPQCSLTLLPPIKKEGKRVKAQKYSRLDLSFMLYLC